ncbi:hypothetical protein F5882DRAFT_377259 [Hyaloscypha sp. PMI_1271]|nr:hypothetical protein F5882DRAFT_377259 [Hyaloscypha sp. PMI_1271]
MCIDSDASSGVMTTWKITFDYLASEHPKSVALFKMMVYLSPVQIPAHIFHAQIPSEPENELITIAKRDLPPLLFDKLDVQEALGTLTAFSFLSYSSDEQHFDIHRLVRLAMLVELGYTGEAQPFTQISLVLALASPEPELSNVMECSKLYPHIEELLSPSNMAGAKEPVSRSLRLNLLLRSMIYLRLHGRTNEALQLAGRIYEEKKTLLEGACSHVTSQFNVRLLHAASMVCNDLEEYGPAKEMGELENKMLENAYGETDPRTLQSLNHLAWIETLPEGDHQKAKYIFEEVIRLTEIPRLRTISIEAKRGLAVLLRDMKQLLQAFQVMLEAVEATGETYGEQSVEFAVGLADLADLQWRDETNQKMEAGANRARALPILLKHLGPDHPKVLRTTYKVAGFIIHFDHLQLDYADHLFRNLVQTPAALILQSDMDPIEMLDGLATVL